MARRIRVPWLVDIIRVSEPAEIAALNAEPGLDRHFVAGGPLVNRVVTGRIRRWFKVDGKPLPSLAPRGDPLRADRQRSLAAELDPAAGKPLWTDAQLQSLAAYVCGHAPREDTAVVAQEIVGQRFDSDFRGDRQSWEAAALVDEFRDGFSLRQIVWMITGRLHRAFEQLARLAGRDRHAMHGIAIGVHGIVGALDRMKALVASPKAGSISEDAALSLCLHPPRRVPRSVATGFPTPATDRRLKPGTLILLELEDAGTRAPNPQNVFMHGAWSFCPAEAFVTELLRAVWREVS